ncbi:pseudouridine synthase [Crocosphaera sp. XPORK-15E]|uniref:pseudouridine synthase n=1 Tax=Crocosphaera sp. XPORK-15E TaxID=3110247 RepID=UPI002B214A1D|nr:pseudouridine synthase [Crocosphaera sp. XPORK-15E]MEA5534042.1 pseudouridine synthase [Crocosphaera sp. XPORK-15E]
MAQRVQKILSQWGIASRRHAEDLILAGRVKLNGQVVSLGDKADPTGDRLEVDGKLIQPTQRPEFLYILINKPVGVVSTCDDPQHRPIVLDLLPEALRQETGIHPVGRLDFNSTGALLLTNDGELTLRLTHPRYHLPKTYEVLVSGHPSEEILQQWRRGVMLMGKKTLPAQVEVMARCHQHTRLKVILTEGKNRQIRRIVQHLGFHVLRLHRSAIGSLSLHASNGTSLPSGHYRLLTPSEIRFLKHCANLTTEIEGKLIQ